MDTRCGGCSGGPGEVVQVGGGARLYQCDGCGGLIGAALRSVLASFVGLDRPMLDEAPDSTYFDVNVLIGPKGGAHEMMGRIHGWYSPTLRRVTQYG